MLIVDPTMQIGGLIVGVGVIVLHRVRAKNRHVATEAGQ
jgi:hypothetical protein